MLKDLGITIGSNTKAGQIFEELVPNFMDVEYASPSEYVSILWEKYQSRGHKNKKLNGLMFEHILATLCIREQIMPFYLNAEVAFVPDVKYDLMFYSSERGLICWSIKTSLRERYKQADLEGMALKNVHRKALNYLITLDEKEAEKVKQKVKKGDVIGLDDVVVATSHEFNMLVKELKSYKFEAPPKIEIMHSNRIVTPEKVKLLFD